MKSPVVESGHSDGEDTVGVTVKVALVAVPASIATGENEDGSLSVTTFLDAIDDGFLDEVYL